MSVLDFRIQCIAAVIGVTKCDLSDEKATQRDISHAMCTAGIDFKHRRRLSALDIPSFLATDIAIEVTLGYASDAFRKLHRYAAHSSVAAVMLVTDTAIGLPTKICGKPARVVLIGGWL